ncbi:hypothetical protein BCR34DRAFT_598818 [Clohesyomyces aquaticus]|uniref:WW domain-containing protein n=1 Tax=Clohesyomyces aquaticus TaxID=1231657 RepID=A0A1Y1ZXD8_9PLEO|nr:hypothetical protein BCR34DRAFT_598818 [Clohesyomyces aquaticus]
MSFGFSVGDFILLTEYAWQLYERCRDAPKKYGDLATEVQHLHAVLDETRIYLTEADKENQIPASSRRLASLVSARRACETTLAELDEFLAKSTSLATRQRRFIEMWKFVIKDSESLQAKLRSNRDLLQLSMVSLTSLSVTHIRKNLDIIVKEYRTGAREPSVLSYAIMDNKPIEQEELLEQITVDLEDKDVHPDNIDLNKPFLLQWLSKLAAEGGLEEAPPYSILTPSEPSHTTTPSYNPFSVETDGSLHTPSYQELASPMGSFQSSLKPSSRRGSASSHASQPDDWRPNDRPDPDYVHSMLRPLFAVKHPEAESSTALRRIKRAFHQQDWTKQGHLARREVLELCTEILRLVDIPHYGDQLQRLVLSFDANKDAQFNEAEFTALMQQMMRNVEVTRLRDRERDFHRSVAKLRKHAESLRETDTSSFLPWGFLDPDGSHRYVDQVRNMRVQKVPRLSDPLAFSNMARDAEVCVASMVDFQQKWVAIVPANLQSSYLGPLTMVRSIAVHFSVFENQENPLLLSDLDATMTCYQLGSNLLEEDDARAFEQIISSLRTTQKQAYQILGFIQAFTHCLSKISDVGITPSAQDFPKLKAIWDNENIEYYANYTAEASPDCGAMKVLVSDVRKKALLSRLEPFALKAAQDHLAQVEVQKARLLETPWKGQVTNAQLSNWSKNWSKPRDVYLQIQVNDPAQTVATKRKRRAANMAWEGTAILDSSINLLPHSQITVSIMYSDNGDSQLKHTFEAHRTTDDFHEKMSNSRDGYVWIIKDHGPCGLVLEIHMDHDQDFQQKLTELNALNWTDLLKSDRLGEEKDAPKIDLDALNKDLPPGWEGGVDPQTGRLYYLDHRMQSTTWVMPRSFLSPPLPQ